MCLYTTALPEYALIAALKRFKSISGGVRTLQCLSVAKKFVDERSERYENHYVGVKEHNVISNTTENFCINCSLSA